jgi:hypothetical protein
MQSNSNSACVEQCRQTIASIDWFANVGGDFDLELPMPVSRVKTWKSAASKARSRKWDNTTLEAQNDLTSWLSLHHKKIYNERWNHLIDLHREQTIDPLKETVWMPLIQKQRLDPRLARSFLWDILGVLMEASYRDMVEHPVDFFGELLRVYAAGHFPCGWKGRYPKGTLIVF